VLHLHKERWLVCRYASKARFRHTSNGVSHLVTSF